jgi:hypothetical protein
MSCHTPGPWTLSKDANFIIGDIVICENIAPTAPKTGKPEWTPIHEANARLIAQAPDMARSLTAMCDAIQEILDRWSSGDLAGAVNYAESAMHEAQEVLAKAGL